MDEKTMLSFALNEQEQINAAEIIHLRNCIVCKTRVAILKRFLMDLKEVNVSITLTDVRFLNETLKIWVNNYLAI